MNDVQELFLRQARSDHVVFGVLRDSVPVEPCHALHYLQMTTEMLAKAYAWRKPQEKLTHKVFVAFLRDMLTNSGARRALGFTEHRESWEARIRGCLSLAREVELLAPAVEQTGPNAEYPWPPNEPTTCPADYDFPVWTRLNQTAAGRQLLVLVRELLDHAEEFF